MYISLYSLYLAGKQAFLRAFDPQEGLLAGQIQRIKTDIHGRGHMTSKTTISRHPRRGAGGTEGIQRSIPQAQGIETAQAVMTSESFLLQVTECAPDCFNMQPFSSL